LEGSSGLRAVEQWRAQWSARELTRTLVDRSVRWKAEGAIPEREVPDVAEVDRDSVRPS